MRVAVRAGAHLNQLELFERPPPNFRLTGQLEWQLHIFRGRQRGQQLKELKYEANLIPAGAS